MGITNVMSLKKTYSIVLSVFVFALRRRSSLILVNLVILALNLNVWMRISFIQPSDNLSSNSASWRPNNEAAKQDLLYQVQTERSSFNKGFFTDLCIPRQEFKTHLIPSIERTSRRLIDCRKILNSDKVELERGMALERQRPKVPISEEEYLLWTTNCDKFKKERGYIQAPTSIEEADYSLAFSISSYRDIEQTERLLRAIYQPQNLYCIHVDVKSSMLFHRALANITRCFKNVWIATRLSKIKWGDVSILMSEINCLKDLLKYFRGRYKYFINLTGQEFPLRTNAELVEIAKIFNGSNDIAGSYSNMDEGRVKFIWKHRWSKTYQQTIFYKSNQPKEPCPLNITFFKGEVHALMSRRFTEYIIENPHAQIFFEWAKNTGHPSEHFWNSLNYNSNLQAPGSYTGNLELAHSYSLQPIVRAKNWVGMWGDQWPCHGQVLRGICVFGLKDVPHLFKRPQLFANKFNLTFESLGLDCLEEAHRNRTQSRRVEIDAELYKNLPTVLYSLKNGL